MFVPAALLKEIPTIIIYYPNFYVNYFNYGHFFLFFWGGELA